MSHPSSSSRLSTFAALPGADRRVCGQAVGAPPGRTATHRGSTRPVGLAGNWVSSFTIEGPQPLGADHDPGDWWQTRVEADAQKRRTCESSHPLPNNTFDAPAGLRVYVPRILPAGPSPTPRQRFLGNRVLFCYASASMVEPQSSEDSRGNTTSARLPRKQVSNFRLSGRG
jgi:hypothetical protein